MTRRGGAGGGTTAREFFKKSGESSKTCLPLQYTVTRRGVKGGVPQKINQKMVLIYTTEDDGRGRPLAIKGGGRVDEVRGAAEELPARHCMHATGVAT